MKSDSKYKIEFAGLKIGSHKFNFNAENKFFDRFNFSDFNHVSVNIDIDLTKKSIFNEKTKSQNTKNTYTKPNSCSWV